MSQDATAKMLLQNAKTVETYYADLDAGHLPVRRGYRMDADDVLRRAVIQELMCHFALDFAAISRDHAIDFKAYFAEALALLKPLAQAGLVEIRDDGLTVLPKGRLLVRILAMSFDRHLQDERRCDPDGRQKYSRVI